VTILDAASSISPVFATLTKNTRGGGYPSLSANSVHSALKSTRAHKPTNPFATHPNAPPLTPPLNPLDAMLTKNEGGVAQAPNAPSLRPPAANFELSADGILDPRPCSAFDFQLSTVNLLLFLAVGCERQTVSFPVPLYPVSVLELDCGLPFDPARAEEDFFPALPPKPAVCLIESRAENAEPFLIRTQDLRRRLQRLLGPADPDSKRLNLRELASGIRYRLTGSALEQIFTYYQHAKHLFPQRYCKLTRLRPPAVLKISLRNAYPRCYVTRRIAIDESGAPTAGAYYGPFPSRKSALAFSELALDLFKVRRCQIKIRRDPTFPGCIYSEMKMCLAPCFAGCTKEEYDAEVHRLVQFLDTNGNSLRSAIEDDRERASADLDFERAAQLHKRIEKLDEALRFRPELARRIANLDAVILQRAAEKQSIGVFGIHAGRLAEPFFLRFAEIASQPRSAEHIFKDYLEGHAPAPQSGEKPVVENAVNSAATISTSPAGSAQGEAEPRVKSAAAAREELSEHLALISRWFYSNPRAGEIFFREKDWPYRKILRACSRLLNSKTAEPPTSESAASGNPPPP
jgi:excinuclease ABC subunit C